jgi:tetratricopeptide (TPR) repeat protein
LDHEEHPDEAFIHFNLAGTYLDLGDGERSVLHLKRCLETAPKGATFLAKVYVLLAKIQAEMGCFDQGIGYCREGKKHFPNDVELWFEEGLQCKAKKNSAEARLCFEHILQMPQVPCYAGVDAGLRGHLTRHHLALALTLEKQFAAAETHWREAIKQAPLYGPAWLGLAELCLEHGRLAEVEQMIDQLHRDARARAIIAALQARMARARGESVNAQEIMRQAIAQAPRNIWLRMLLTDMMLRDGKDLDGAERLLQEVLAIEPKQKLASQRLQELRERRAGSAAQAQP